MYNGGKMRQKENSKIVDTIKWLLNSYCRAVGIGVIFAPIDGEPITTAPGNRHFCDFCQLIQKNLSGKKACLNTFFKSTEKASELGFHYIYQCHAGLIEWSAPLWCNGELLGSFISGGVLMRRPDKSFLNEVIRINKPPGINELSLKEVLDKIKVVSEEKVRAAADILFIMANYLAKMELVNIKLRQEKYLQQAKISEEIQRIKRTEIEILEQEVENENSFLPIASLYPLETERELLSRVRLGDKEGAKEVLNEILGQILFKNAGHIELVRARILELAVVLSRAAVEAKAELEMVLGLNFEYIQEIRKLKSIEELCIWIVKVLDRFTEAVYENRNTKNVDIIRKVREFIWTNYKRKITLQDISRAAYLSPYYLSRIFKQETGSTILEYLTKVRIEEAKRLLENTSWSTTQIAFEVGYLDQSYFCKVFKKVENISTSEYKEKMKR